MKSQARERLNAIAAVARPLMAIDPARLDAERWVLNVQNGMVDLTDGAFEDAEEPDLNESVVHVDFGGR